MSACKRLRWFMLSLSAIGLTTGRAVGEESPPRIVTFDDQKVGQQPKGMTCALTGQGRPGEWTLKQDDTAASRSLVLAQTDADSTGYRFPHCVVDGFDARDVDLRVKLKPVAGREDRAGGLVLRYRDADNYYVVRANALESNVVLYKVEKGKRADLKPKGAGFMTYGRKAKVPSGVWSDLGVVARGSLLAVSWNGETLFEVEDSTFLSAGRVGVWTKADSVTYFDELKLSVAK